MRTALLAAVAAVSLVFAACGGGDGEDTNRALTYDGFVEAANGVCTSVNEQVDPISEKLTGKAAQDAEVYDELIPELVSAREDMEALEPPEELQAAHDDFVSLVREQETAAEDAKAAAEAGDQKEYLRVLKSLDGSEVDLAASKLGAAECID